MATPDQIAAAQATAAGYLGQPLGGAPSGPITLARDQPTEADLHPAPMMGPLDLGLLKKSGSPTTVDVSPKQAAGIDATNRALAAAPPVAPHAPGPPSPPSSALQPAPAMPPPQMQPAGWMPGSHEVAIKHGRPVPEDAKYAEAASEGLGQEAAQHNLEVARQQGAADAEYQASKAGVLQANQESMARLQREKNNYVGEQKDKLNAMSQDLQKSKVDPNEYFRERGTGAAILSTVAVALGQLGMAFAGAKSNYAIDNINAAIDRNIKAQEEAIKSKREGLEDEKNLMKINLDAFGDREKAIAATKVQYLDIAQNTLDQRYADIKGTEGADANYAAASQKIQQERAKTLEDFGDKESDSVTEQMSEHYSRGGLAGAGAQNTALYVPTLGGYARDEASARKLNEVGAMRMQIDQNLARAIEIKKEAADLSDANPGNWSRLYQLNQELNALASDSDTKKTVLEGQGAMSGGDKRNTEEALGAMRGVTAPRGILLSEAKNLEATKARNLEQHRMAGEAYGIKRGDAVYVQGPGGPQERARLEGQNRTPSHPTTGVDDLIKPIGSKK